MSQSDDEILPKYKDADTEKWRQLIGLAVGIIAIGIASMLMFGDSIWKVITPVYNCESEKYQRLAIELYAKNMQDKNMTGIDILRYDSNFTIRSPSLKNIKAVSRPDPSAAEKTYTCQATISSIWPASRMAAAKKRSILTMIEPGIFADGEDRISHGIIYKISKNDKKTSISIEYPESLHAIFIELTKKPSNLKSQVQQD